MVTKLEARGKEIFQWGEKFVDITTLERQAYQVGLAVARKLMADCIEQADQILSEQRDRKVPRNKGYRTTTLNTVHQEKVQVLRSKFRKGKQKNKFGFGLAMLW